MISKAGAQAYRTQLLSLLDRLGRERAQLEDEVLRPSGGLSNAPLQPADLGSHSIEEEVTLDLLENEEQLIEQINAALDRLNEGLYGRCAACGQVIARKRLQALPYARHCVACARNRQRKAVL